MRKSPAIAAKICSKLVNFAFKIGNTNKPQPYLLGLIPLLCLSFCPEIVNAYPKPIPLTQPRQLQAQTNTADTNRAAAQKAEAQAKKLKLETTPITQVIAKWEEALKYWRLAGDRQKEANTLDRIAKLYWFRGEYPKALEYAQKALPICQALGDRDCEGAASGSLALIYQKMGEYEKAIANKEQLPSLFPETEIQPSVFWTTGQIYAQNLGEKQKALDYYNKALDYWKEKGNVVEQAQILDYIALTYAISFGEINKSFDYITQANNLDPEFKRDRSILDLIYPSLQSSICSDKLASIKKPPKIDKSGSSSNQSATKNNIEFFKEEAQKWRTRGIIGAEADFLEMLGSSGYSRVGEYQKALEVYQQALKLRQIMGGKPNEASTLTDIADILNRQGKKQEAINALNQALDIQRQIKTRPAEAATLLTLGDVYLSLGAYPESVNVYKQSLGISQIIGDRSNEADTLHKLGAVYRKLQDYQQALNYYQQALLVSKTTGNCHYEALSLGYISQTYLNSGDYQQAISFGNQAITLSRNLEIDEYKLAIEAGTLNFRAQVKIKQGNYSQALEDSGKARKLGRESGFKELEARVIAPNAEAYAALKQPEKAIQAYQEQLALYTQMGLSSEQAQSLYNIAKLQRQNNQLQAALTQIDKAITIIENIRRQVASQDLRTSFFATVQDYYQLKIDILMGLHKKEPTKGYDGKALHISERSRARSLIELLTEANADIRNGVDPTLLAQEQQLQQSIDAKNQLLQEASTKPNTETITAKLKQELEELLSQQKELITKIRTNSPKYARLKYPEPLKLSQIQQQLDKDTLLLEYSLGEEHSYLWAVTPTSISSYELPKRADIDVLAKNFRSLINSRDGINVNTNLAHNSKMQSAVKLSQLLLSPVADQLGQKRLIIVADGSLQSIPFTALPDFTAQGTSVPEKGKQDNPSSEINGKVNYQPLLIQHEIINLPSVTVLANQRQALKGRKHAPKTLAILANPVFDANDETRFPHKNIVNNLDIGNQIKESQLKQAARNFNRGSWGALPGTVEEAKGILKLVPANETLQAFDFDANYNWVISKELSQYRFLHFATHGFADPNNPELSGIVLSLVDKTGKSIDGYLQLGDIFNLNFPADLVVLSACETGLGKDVSGEGLVGLTRGLMYAGAERVAVSLWMVDDDATAKLMQEFYKQMLQKGKSPTAALREAQLKLWKDPNPNLNKPRYWAAFTLQGEWR
ncbi:MAG: CHAT domain-containing protein [Nostoc sp.]|uniref:CHAT domain-containing protein n=1 Tax=Nostoc sp. TaxID=1180 RepID=UPI002FFB90C9